MGFLRTIFTLFTVHTLIIMLWAMSLPNIISIILVLDLEREFGIFTLIIPIIPIYQRRSWLSSRTRWALQIFEHHLFKGKHGPISFSSY